GTGPDDVWMTEGADLWRRDGTGWSRIADDGWKASVPPPRMWTVSGVPAFTRARAAAPGDLWLIGVQNNSFTGGTGFILHRTGDTSAVTILDRADAKPSLQYGFEDIWIASPTDIWLSG